MEIKIPLEYFTLITGVSGSGKSSLMLAYKTSFGTDI